MTNQVSESKVSLSHEQRVELAMATIQHKEAVLGVLSTQVADKFGKDHKNVMRDVKNLISTVDAEFSRLNFEPCTYVGDNGKTLPAYILTEAGFSLLVMGFTGEEAVKWKIAYITAFQRMREALLNRKPEEDADEDLPSEVKALVQVTRMMQAQKKQLAQAEVKVQTLTAQVTEVKRTIEVDKSNMALDTVQKSHIEAVMNQWFHRCGRDGKMKGMMMKAIKSTFIQGSANNNRWYHVAQKHYEAVIALVNQMGSSYEQPKEKV